MAVVELTKEQVFDLVRQVPAEQKREMILSLAANAPAERAKRQQFAEEQLKALVGKHSSGALVGTYKIFLAVIETSILYARGARLFPRD
jgi:hypothetical protein